MRPWLLAIIWVPALMLHSGCDGDSGDVTVSACAGRGGDADQDDVCQADDNCPDAVNPDQRDQDDDGFGDACDATPEPCDDLGGDTDGDTVCDVVDNCPEHANFGQADFDHDGVGDACDPTGPTACAGMGADLDGDDWCGTVDNCPLTANVDQADIDGDGIGDVCDVEECDGVDNDGDGSVDEGFTDSDGDGSAVCVDPCDDVPNVDADSDGVVDCVDPCPGDPTNDTDFDGICGATDNCPGAYNPSQQDNDADGTGNACDVEACDGIDNDGDGAVDEGLPDEDADGTCNQQDPCPMDPINDDDGDLICGNTDNCPHVGNAAQTDDDGDGWGNACDVDSTESCGAAAPLAAPGQAVPSNLPIADLVADPTEDVLYASVAGTDPTFGNSIVAVDASTATIAWSLFVGSDPGPLAISDDGSVLYVGLTGASSVRMVNVPARRACLSFPLAVDSFFGPLRAGDIEALPGSRETVIVSTRRPNVSPDFGGVYVYDNGLERPAHTPDHTGARMIVVASPTIVYGYNNSSTEFGFRRLLVEPGGITNDWVVSDLFTGFATDILFAAGRVYSTNGKIVDPTVPVALGSIAVTGPVAVAPEAGEVYYAISSTTIAVYDTSTFLFLRNIGVNGVTGTPRKLVRWGPGGLAMLTSARLAILDGVVGP